LTATRNPAELPIHFAGAMLEQSRHICAFFDSPDDEHRVLDPYVKEGLDRGEKAFHIVDPALRQNYVERLEHAGIPVTEGEQTGQFELRTWDQAYLRHGHFDQDAMLALIQEVLDDGHRAGFPLTRLVAHMEWALEDRPGVDDLVVYETRLNFVLPRYKDPVV
jgi:hypothetical protein